MDSDELAFARIYDRYFTGFVTSILPGLAQFLEDQRCASGLPPSLLDLCCGTGQLARFFAEQGYRVVALDRSAGMRELAAERCTPLLDDGRVTVVGGDARSFQLPERVTFATSTFDSLNYLDGSEALLACFRCVRQALHDGGLFVFDMHTRSGIRQTNHVNVRDADDDFFVSRVLYDPARDRLVARVSGFVHDAGGQWRRFEQSVAQAAYPVQLVLDLLEEAGWKHAWPATPGSFAERALDPESLLRAFFVARA
jgi:SAM-dependent methyltransferase